MTRTPAGPRAVVVFLVLLVLAQSGCALARRSVPTEKDRRSFGVVGVAAGRFTPEAGLDVPAKGALQGAGLGASVSVLVGFGAGAYTFHPYGLAVGGAAGIAFSPIAALIGAGSAMPGGEAAASDESIRAMSAPLDPQGALRDAVFEAARDAASRRLLLLGDVGPAAAGDNVDYSFMADRGVDTVLEVAVQRIGLSSSQWGSDPPLRFSMEARCRLVQVRGGRTLLATALRTTGENAAPLSSWTAGDGMRYREEFRRRARDLASRIVYDLFLLYLFPGERLSAAASMEPAWGD